MGDQEETCTTEQKTLEVTRFYKAFKVKRDIDYDIDFNLIVHRFETDILTEHLASELYIGQTEFGYPRSTWQMFKTTHVESWWLGWLVRRRPVELHYEVKDVKIKVDRYLKYPEAKVEFKDLGHPIPYETIKEI